MDGTREEADRTSVGWSVFADDGGTWDLVCFFYGLVAKNSLAQDSKRSVRDEEGSTQRWRVQRSLSGTVAGALDYTMRMEHHPFGKSRVATYGIVRSTLARHLLTLMVQ